MTLFELAVNIGANIGKLETGIKKAGSLVAGFAKVSAAAIGAGAVAVGKLTAESVKSFAEYEQLAGGVEKIFNEMDNSKIIKDAANAYKTLGMSANDYLSRINDMGAAFAATMGDEAGYAAAQKGLQAVSNFASGTGKSVDTLSEKLTLITRSTSSYQSIADQFSGILPATSKDFLQQAQAAGFLEKKYKDLTKVPIAEYQEAVVEMMTLGVEQMGLAGNTEAEAFNTITGSLEMTKSAYENWLVSLAQGGEEQKEATDNLIESALAFAGNVLPVAEQVLGSLGSALSENLPQITSTLTAFVTDNAADIAGAGADIIIAIATGLASALPQLVEQLPQIWEEIKSAAENAWPDIKEAGSQLFGMLWEGIKAGWQKIVDWFNGVWNGLFADLVIGVSVNKGSSVMGHANGLDYVPYDNYPAMLHRGEAVLTAREAKAWKNGGSGGGNVINIYPQNIDDATIDYLFHRFNAEMGAAT